MGNEVGRRSHSDSSDEAVHGVAEVAGLAAAVKVGLVGEGEAGRDWSASRGGWLRHLPRFPGRHFPQD